MQHECANPIHMLNVCTCSQALNQSSLTSTINNQHLVYRFFIFKNSIFYFFNFEISKNWRFFFQKLRFFFFKILFEQKNFQFFCWKNDKICPKKTLLVWNSNHGLIVSWPSQTSVHSRSKRMEQQKEDGCMRNVLK